MLQIIIKIVITICLIYVLFLFLRLVWTKEIDLKYPLNWIQNKVEKSIPTTTSGINISPRRVILKTSNWKGMTSFNIYNTTSEMLYNLYIKLIIENAGIHSEDIEVIPANRSDFIEKQLGDFFVNFDTIKIWGTDSKDKECIFLIIYSLGPHENKSFKINPNKVLSSDQGKAKIFINLVEYSKEPVQVLSQGENKVAFPIKFLEQIKVKGTAFFIKKK